MTVAMETKNQDANKVESNKVDILALLKVSSEQKQALHDKWNKLAKNIKRDARIMVGASFEDEVELYSAYILAKMANDFLAAQMRDKWVSELEIYIPRLNTKDSNLQKSTDAHIAKIALEITDPEQRVEIQTLLKKNLLPKSTNAFELLKCFDRLEELFTNAWKA